MKSAASHFFTSSNTRDITIPHNYNNYLNSSSFNSTTNKLSHMNTFNETQSETNKHNKQILFTKMIHTPRPILIYALLFNTLRFSEAALLLDGFPCNIVCFVGRVVRCEGPRCNNNNNSNSNNNIINNNNIVNNNNNNNNRSYSALLVSDTTGMIPVMWIHTENNNNNNINQTSTEAAFDQENNNNNNNNSAILNERNMKKEYYDEDTMINNSQELQDVEYDILNENDYIFVMGRIVFADTSKEVEHLVQGAEDFISSNNTNNTDNTNNNNNCNKKSIDHKFCIRGSVRIINDMNEIHYWTLSALETHLRLVAKSKEMDKSSL